MQYALNSVIMVLQTDKPSHWCPAVTHMGRAVDQNPHWRRSTWIGANEVWDGTATGMETLGDGVVIAVRSALAVSTTTWAFTPNPNKFSLPSPIR